MTTVSNHITDPFSPEDIQMSSVSDNAQTLSVPPFEPSFQFIPPTPTFDLGEDESSDSDDEYTLCGNGEISASYPHLILQKLSDRSPAVSPARHSARSEEKKIESHNSDSDSSSSGSNSAKDQMSGMFVHPRAKPRPFVPKSRTPSSFRQEDLVNLLTNAAAPLTPPKTNSKNENTETASPPGREDFKDLVDKMKQIRERRDETLARTNAAQELLDSPRIRSRTASPVRQDRAEVPMTQPRERKATNDISSLDMSSLDTSSLDMSSFSDRSPSLAGKRRSFFEFPRRPPSTTRSRLEDEEIQGEFMRPASPYRYASMRRVTPTKTGSEASSSLPKASSLRRPQTPIVTSITQQLEGETTNLKRNQRM